MPTSGHHPHGTTAYAPPVTCRAPSPASSIGTVYDDDATSDTEHEMSTLEFERFCEDKIKLWHPRPEEERAERDILVTDKARGAGGEAEQALFEKIMGNLRAEIKVLDDEEIYERAMMKGSQIGLELQPPTSDIDKIMRSMMSSSFTLNGPGTTILNPTSSQPPNAPVTKGPWNNYGKKPPSLKSPLFSLAGFSTSGPPTVTTTGASTTTEEGMHAEHGLSQLSSTDVSGVLTPPWPKSKPSSRTEDGTSDGTVVGGKRTRNGLARR